MRITPKAIVVALLGLFLSGTAWSAVQVVFVNGASGSTEGAVTTNAGAFAASMRANGVPSDYRLTRFEIRQSITQSAAALFCQREFSGESMPISGERPTSSNYSQYLAALGARYQDFTVNVFLNPIACLNVIGQIDFGVLQQQRHTERLASIVSDLARTPDTIVLVGHSQGSNYIEAAIALAVARGDLSSPNRVKVVSIGSPAFTSQGDHYVNVTTDDVVYGFTLKRSLSLPGNYTACIGTCAEVATLEDLVANGADNSLHLLRSTYLNPSIMSVEQRESLPRSIAKEVIAAAAQPTADTDNDLLRDAIDRCPTVFAYTEDGCPASLPPSDVVTYRFTARITGVAGLPALTANGVSAPIGGVVSGRLVYNYRTPRSYYWSPQANGFESSEYDGALTEIEISIDGTQLIYRQNYSTMIGWIVPRYSNEYAAVHEIVLSSMGTANANGTASACISMTPISSFTPLAPLNPPLPFVLPALRFNDNARPYNSSQNIGIGLSAPGSGNCYDGFIGALLETLTLQ